MRSLSIGLGLVLLGVIVILVFSALQPAPERTAHRSDELPPSPGTHASDLPPPPASSASPQAVTLLPVAHTAATLNSLESSPNEDFLIIEALLDQFRRHFGGNPIGDNDDIVAALRGRNTKALAYLPADHPALDSEGQLLDRWGTPYRFHALSGKHMEIRSAGPDREFWNNDDLVHSPQL